MNKIKVVKYVYPAIVAAALTAVTVGAFYLHSKSLLEKHYEKMLSNIRTIEAIDAIFLNDDMKIVTGKDSVHNNCTLFHKNKRLRGENFFEHIKNTETELNLKLCTYLQSVQNLRYTGFMQNVYVGFNEDEKNEVANTYFMSSSSFPANYKDTEQYSAFSLNEFEFELSLSNLDVKRLIYIKNTSLPHLNFDKTILNPFFITFHPNPLMDLRAYAEKIKNSKLIKNTNIILYIYLFFNAAIFLIWKVKVIDIYKLRAKMEFNNLLKDKHFIIIESKNNKTTLVYCSEKENIAIAKVTYYNHLGLELEQYDESACFVKVKVDDFLEHYRLVEVEKSLKLTHSRVAISDKKNFESIRYYKNNYTKDALTGLYNRTELKSFVSENQNATNKFLIALIDLDKFKDFNDIYGHDFGDTILVHTANFLKRNFKHQDDIILRVGGEEFLLIFSIESEINTLIGSIEKRLLSFNQQAISLSGGMTIWDPTCETFNCAHKRADELLYISKNNGRAQITIDPKLDTSHSHNPE